MTSVYKKEDLEGLLYKELADICKDNLIRVQGKKTNLVKLILAKQTKGVVVPAKPTTKKSKTTKSTSKAIAQESDDFEPEVTATATGTRKRKATTTSTPPPPAAAAKKKAAPKKKKAAVPPPPAAPKKAAPKKKAAANNTTATTTAAVGQVIAESTTVTTTTVEETTAAGTESTTTVEETTVTTTTAPIAETTPPTPPAATFDADPDNEVIALRMNREGCNSGELHASLIWNDIADLDLHVITPSNEHLYYGQKESRCGGWLDRDMNAGGNSSEEPIENIFWASAPSGKYKIYVRHFSCHCRSGDPRFSDPRRSVPFRVRLIRAGQTDWFESSVAPQQDVTCFEFNLQGSGAVGSFVVVPPHNQPATFEELCARSNISYTTGEGYYALKKKEDISQKKDMVLHNTVSDTFTIGHIDVCVLLGQPTNKNISLAPKDLPPNTRLFVQSTSHNRKIPADTHVLMKVSVKEALRFRQSSKYNFK
eukprot:gene14560-17207_t